MSVLYDFACPNHGRFEAFGAVGAHAADCPVCGRLAGRRFSVPVTDCASIGRDMYRARSRPTDRRPNNEIQEDLIRGYQRRDRTHIQFGAGQTTGS